MAESSKITLMTMCLVLDGDKVLLIERPPEKGFPGYIGAGGKVDYPESIAEGAIREVKEETGLTVTKLIYKGLDEFTDLSENLRYMVFNYTAAEFEGELLENPPEGKLKWVPVAEALELPMQGWFRERFPLFFEEGTFEVHKRWDGVQKDALKESIRKL
ncbi:8-oxo-dGTP diphosphatase [Planococcus salinarum]|uniref:8-oxo-dGTP diphosphatase n=1 Tax=Planococcus salinarum TaxID=622695 RepID=UPI000E3E9846|nr:8-oxo-dGTP diphosphatase [Planococcus salinarum]TAA72375.1 8-oxo-dGTP diphosphatase [Planococcus salinarum]